MLCSQSVHWIPYLTRRYLGSDATVCEETVKQPCFIRSSSHDGASTAVGRENGLLNNSAASRDFAAPVVGHLCYSLSVAAVRLEAYFEGHSIAKPKRRALLVAALNDNVVKVQLGRCHPQKADELSYEDVVKHLEEEYAPKVNETAAS
ncbi:hypothetical protein HPB47_016350 [Ixodes persulcatus]|uniref:Uncharacterized protein n=1 Tax=Ixodes persulcatus TaxID=34615 RepID=A0AC60R0K4_IXOPE|nr:hypothetical protein HPB47_016350 [Ixodes persulcatus]